METQHKYKNKTKTNKLTRAFFKKKRSIKIIKSQGIKVCLSTTFKNKKQQGKSDAKKLIIPKFGSRSSKCFVTSALQLCLLVRQATFVGGRVKM